MEIYKKGQGKIVRMTSFILLLLLIFYLCYEIYDLPSTESWLWKPLVEKMFIGKRIIIRPILLVSAAIFGALSYISLKYLNRPAPTDFLIETEDELRRVSWPPRKEYMTSSFVIIIVMIIFSAFLFGADKGLSFLLHKFGIGF